MLGATLCFSLRKLKAPAGMLKTIWDFLRGAKTCGPAEGDSGRLREEGGRTSTSVGRIKFSECGLPGVEICSAPGETILHLSI